MCYQTPNYEKKLILFFSLSGKKPQSGDRIKPGASAPGYQDSVRIRPEGAEENVADGVANPVRQRI
ncbi:MAG: hypothetical protein DRI57_05375 [Deltaproteobacteria bacterium]|nr:MAG: hypothetical protein DRI57_05375 [Deltaproteobacteria bacterium]